MAIKKLFFHDNLPLVNLRWEVYKGQSNVREDFTRATLWLWLVTKDNRIPISAVTENGAILATIPTTLAPGIYHLKAIWVKRSSYNFNGTAIQMGKQLGMETRVVSEVRNAFQVVCRSSESDTYGADAYELKFVSAAATYGYDGLDVYELAVMRGKTLLSEEEYLATRGPGNGVDPYQKAVEMGFVGTEEEFWSLVAQRPVDNLDTEDENQPLSARQGTVLKDKIERNKYWFNLDEN